MEVDVGNVRTHFQQAWCMAMIIVVCVIVAFMVIVVCMFCVVAFSVLTITGLAAAGLPE